MKKIKLAYLVSHPIQYQAPLLKKISQEPDIDLTVFFLSDLSSKEHSDPEFGQRITWDVPLLDGFKYQFLPAIGSRDRISFFRPLTYGLISRLKNGKFDALWVHGYAHLSVIFAIYAAKILGIKVLMRGESNLISRERSRTRSWIKTFCLTRLFKTCDALLYIGTLNKDYYSYYKVPTKKLFAMPYAVDNEFFQTKAREATEKASGLRRELGLTTGRPVILFSSKLISRKNPMDLLDAYVGLSPDGKSEPRPYLVFVGSGEELPALQNRAKAIGWNSILFAGFRNQTEIPSFLELCDVFVLPSVHETWGLVINEAMNAGKPVIVTNEVGCASDLVKNEENGFVVSPGDIPALTESLRKIIESEELRKKMGSSSLRRVKSWSFEQDIQGLKHALNDGVTRHSPQ